MMDKNISLNSISDSGAIYLNDMESLELLPPNKLKFYCGVRDNDCTPHYFTAKASAINYVWEPILDYYKNTLNLPTQEISSRFSNFIDSPYSMDLSEGETNIPSQSPESELCYYVASVPEDERYNGWVMENRFEE